QNLSDVVVLRPGVEDGEGALTPHFVQPPAAGAAKLVDLGPGKNLKHAFGRYPRVHGSISVSDWCCGMRPDARAALGQGRISIGVDSRVISQMSTMSEFETAMHPSVQSQPM